MKIYMRLDKQSISESVRNLIITNNRLLSSLDDDILVFRIDPIEFTHAYQLLGESSTRFGNDLQLYLGTVNTFFRNINHDGLLTLGFGDSDFKRKVSEDLSVGISSLFMVKSFGIKWETIAQIPSNKKLSKFRPDFEGFSAENDRYLWESKGRTSPSTILNAINKAINQVKSYPEKAKHKFAIITYFSTDDRAFPSKTFVIDPQLPDILLPDMETAKYLHYIKVLEFSGFLEAKKAYIDYLFLMFRKKLSLRGTDTWQYNQRINDKIGFISSAIDRIREDYEQTIINNYTFLCKTTEIEHEDTIYIIKRGVMDSVLNSLSNGLVPDLNVQNYLNSAEGVSIFSDGTFFNISVEAP